VSALVGQAKRKWVHDGESRHRIGEVGQHRDLKEFGKEVSVDRQDAQRQPVGTFLANPMGLVEPPDYICPWTAARYQQHGRARRSNPMAQPIPQVRQIEKATADFADD
jgi:hypothetical protein